MGSEQARLLAERIARRIDGGSVRDSSPAAAPNLAAELSAMRSTLNELQTRLSRIESKVTTSPSVPQVHSPWLAGLNDSHPSQDRFGVEEATVAQLVDYFQGEKACSMEPGKPCDHCAMCSSRGF